MDAISTDSAPRAIGPYSQAIRAGQFLFLSGQIGLDPGSGTLVAGGIPAETRQALQNLEAVLRAGGSSMDRVVRTTVYLVDLGEFEAMNAVYAQAMPSPAPARSTVQAARLPRGARVEIDAIALI